MTETQTADQQATTPVAAVDLDAIAHNVRVLRERAGSAQVMAVVKADGYGHGAAQVGRAALAAVPPNSVWRRSVKRWRCAATASRRRCWRGCIRRAPISVPRSPADVQLGVSSVREVDDVLDAVRRTGVTATVTVKVDTGSEPQRGGRRGLPRPADRLGRAAAEDSIRVRGIMSHLSHGDDPDLPTTICRRSG